MKTVLLLRHAKSGYDDPALADADRPLAQRGKAAATLMGGFIQRSGYSLDHVLVSPARRTTETWERIATCLSGDEPPVQTDEGLYLASAERLLCAIQSVAGDAACVMLIGHNPGMAVLADRLCGAGDTGALQQMRSKYPTGALAEIRFDIENWTDVSERAGTLVRFIRPKDVTQR